MGGVNGRVDSADFLAVFLENIPCRRQDDGVVSWGLPCWFEMLAAPQ